jgi:hypothetical protein
MLTVYSAIYAGRDTFHKPVFRSPDIRYVLYTDHKFKCDGVEVITDNLINCPARASRYWKTHPPKGDSIWIDGSFQVVSDPLPWFNSITKPCGLIRHEKRTDAFKEAIQVAARNKDRPMTILRQMMKYTAEGMPCDFGLWEGGVIGRKAGCPRDWQNAWWEEIQTESTRDQLSLAYIIWKFRPKFQELTSRPTFVKMYDHAREVRVSKPRKKVVPAPESGVN